jgi:hypothetical protein
MSEYHRRPCTAPVRLWPGMLLSGGKLGGKGDCGGTGQTNNRWFGRSRGFKAAGSWQTTGLRSGGGENSPNHELNGLQGRALTVGSSQLPAVWSTGGVVNWSKRKARRAAGSRHLNAEFGTPRWCPNAEWLHSAEVRIQRAEELGIRGRDEIRFEGPGSRWSRGSRAVIACPPHPATSGQRQPHLPPQGGRPHLGSLRNPALRTHPPPWPLQPTRQLP